jgi:hypothetical protein
MRRFSLSFGKRPQRSWPLTELNEPDFNTIAAPFFPPAKQYLFSSY